MNKYMNGKMIVVIAEKKTSNGDMCTVNPTNHPRETNGGKCVLYIGPASA